MSKFRGVSCCYTCLRNTNDLVEQHHWSFEDFCQFLVAIIQCFCSHYSPWTKFWNSLPTSSQQKLPAKLLHMFYTCCAQLISTDLGRAVGEVQMLSLSLECFPTVPVSQYLCEWALLFSASFSFFQSCKILMAHSLLLVLYSFFERMVKKNTCSVTSWESSCISCAVSPFFLFQ